MNGSRLLSGLSFRWLKLWPIIQVIVVASLLMLTLVTLVALLDRRICGELTLATSKHDYDFQLGSRRLTLLIEGNSTGRFRLSYYERSEWDANDVESFFSP